MTNHHLNHHHRSGLATFKASLFFKIVDWCLIYTMVFLCITVDSLTYRNSVHAAELPDSFGLSELIQAGRSAQNEANLFKNKLDADLAGSANRKPVAHAGAAQTVPLHSDVQLDGSASIDPNGDRLNYHWRIKSKPNGSTSQLQDGQVVNTQLNIDQPGDYVIELVVDDGQLNSDPATVAISTHNSPPVARAGRDQTVLKGTRVKLDGTGSSDVDGHALKHHWQIIQRPKGSKARLDDPNAVQPHFKADESGDYVVRLHVEDKHHQGDDCDVHISTHDSRPVANAGPDQSVHLNQTVNLDGSGSTDVDGSTLHYHWSFTNVPDGSTAHISDPGAVKPNFVADRLGTYVVQLSVGEEDDCWKEHDDDHQRNEHERATDTVVISAEDRKPVANAGPDQTVPLNQLVYLDGSASQDPDGTPITDYVWSFTSVPPNSHAAISDEKAHNPDFLTDQPGTYSLQLLVKSGGLTSEPDIVIIQTANSKPVTNAGPAQQVKQLNIVHLDGSLSSDADHDPLSYRWFMLSKPSNSSANIQPIDAVNPSFISDYPGDYVPQLIVNDGKLDSDPVTTTITATPLNHAPTITSTPVTTATVGIAYSYDVNATDPDTGDVLTYALLTASNGMSIDPSTGVVSWTPAANQAGSNGVTVQVNDSKGLTDSQSFIIEVAAQPPVNHPPFITSTPITVASVGTGYKYDVDALDPDLGDILVYALTDTAPTGMTIDPGTGLIEWMPTASQVGENFVTVKVTDTGGLLAEQSFTLNVGANTGNNLPPVITSTPNTAEWVQLIPAGTSPTARAGIGNGYDAFNDRLIIFGGLQFDNTKLNDVWVLTNATGATGTPAWVQISPTGGPPQARQLSTVVYDPTANRLIVYGGCTGNCGTTLSDVWVLTNANGLGGNPEWIQLPSGQTNTMAGSAYDPISNRMMVFGGLPGGPNTELNTVRVLADANGVGDPHWIDLAPTGIPPKPRYGLANIAYDPTTNSLTVFGGYQKQANTEFNDTWVLANANGLGGIPHCQQVVPQGMPPSVRSDMPISHAPNSNRLIVYGGLNRLPQTHSDDDTWVLTHANGQGGTPAWISLNPKGALPPPRQSHASGYDSRHNRFVAVMGVSEDANLPAQFLNDTWVLKNASGNCTAGQACNYDVDATDPDVGDVLTYALVSAPQGMSIDPATGLIQWTPAGNQAGDHTIIVEAVDQGGLIGTQTFTLTVEGVAVPNVQGLAPEWADAMFQAAGLNSGAKTSLGGAITLNFDTLPSEQGWVYAGAYLGVPIQTGQGWTYRPASPVVPEGQVFSVNNGALFQNSIGVGYDAEVGHRYDFLGGLR